MKLFMGALFATLALSGVLSLPARVEDAEVIGESRSSETDTLDDGFGVTHFNGVVDTGSVNPFLQADPSSIHFGFFKPLNDFFNSLFTRLPTGFFNGGSSESNEDDLGPLNIPAIDTKNGNTTSTVKVVDGHKVEINETVFGDENNLFRVRLVNIRPLEEDETVEDASPVTHGPSDTTTSTESHESDEKREPLEKKPSDNEIQGNIDQPEHSIGKKENIVETTTAATEIDTTMLPTAEDINAAFVTDNGLEQQEYSAAVTAEEELNGVSGNGNNEFETNMSGENNNNNNSNNNSNNNDHDDNNYSDDNIDKVENVEVEHTIENNEDTEEEANDNLNESSSSNSADVSDKEQVHNDDNDNDNDEDVLDVAEAEAEADIEIVNFKKKNSNYSAAIRNREREGESSSDDEDANAMAAEMNPTFNDEWGNLNEPINEQNDFGNDIDVYDALPIDLSNDIAVNDAANLPINPDAEFIDVYGLQHSSNTMPKFEKLSLNYQLPPSREDWTNAPTK